MSSEPLLDQYKALTTELNHLDQECERVKGEREVVCGKLLARDGKGFAYDLGDGMPMVIATTKIGSHYMAPKNKWQKSGRPPKPPKVARVKAEKPPKEVKPATRRAIVGGKIVEIPIDRKSSVPPAASAPKQPKIPKPSPVPASVLVEPPASDDELDFLSEAAAALPPAKKPEPPKVEKPEAPQKPPLDPLDAALAELDIE